MAIPSTRSNRDNTFDFLRLFAAIVVVVAHAQVEISAPFLWGGSQLFDGVGIFFIISGMLVWKSAESTYRRTGKWSDFFLNRFLRVAPAVYVFAVAAPLVMVAVGAIALAKLMNFQIVVWLGSTLALLPNYHPQIWANFGTINGQLYTIPAEISYYLVIPLAFMVAKRFGFNTMLIAFAALAIVGPIIGYAMGGVVQNAFHHTFIERAGFFVAGVFWAKYWGRVPAKWWIFAVALAVYLAEKIFFLSVTRFEAISPLLLAIPLSYAVVFFGYRGPRILTAITKHLGDLSYGTYIWHALVVVAFVWFGWIGQWWQVLAILLISLTIAQLSWRLVEKPMLSLKRVSSHPTSKQPVSAPLEKQRL